MVSGALPLMTALPEILLERQAIGGDREAWDALVRRHERRVRLTLIARGIPADAARELTQAAWVRLIERQRLGQIREMKLPGLAIAQALFLAKDLARSEGRWAGADGLERAIDGTAPPEERVIGRDQLLRVQAALAGQHVSARRVFSLAHGGEGHSHAEIAAATGLSSQRVKQILCELRRRLRPILEETR